MSTELHSHILPEGSASILDANDRVQQIIKVIKQDDSIDEKRDLPGLADLIHDWFDPAVTVDPEDFTCRLLRVFKESSDATYETVLAKYPGEQQTLFNDLVDRKVTFDRAANIYGTLPSVGRREKVAAPPQTAPVHLLPSKKKTAFEDMSSPAGTGIRTSMASKLALRAEAHSVAPGRSESITNLEAYTDLVFENWSRTVKNTPETTYVPQTSSDVQRIVKHAKQSNKGVRVSGFRHSWSPVFGRSDKKGATNNGDILISTLGLANASLLPNFTSLPTEIFQPALSELNLISVADGRFVNGKPLTGGKQYVRVGCSTTNEQLRRWCIDIGNVTLPMNIIEVEITMGGSNACICHGAGIRNPSLSDLVRCIEYVDANGEMRKIDMATPKLLRAASGCFGLIGVVTHLTLEFDPMSAALMKPRKVPVIQAIPLPPDMKYEDIPEPLRPKRPLTLDEKQKFQQDFERRANEDDYAEWFWFPYWTEVWVNTWAKDPSLKEVRNYPSNSKTILQVLGTIAMNIAQNADIILKATELLPYQQTTFLSWLAMIFLDDVGEDAQPIKTWLPDALHFQRGVQNIRVRDVEVQIPLHAKPGNTSERDYTNAQRAWWDAIIKCYEHKETCPMRMPLEMRIMGGSEVTMAPQRGNTLGTCSIEILTLRSVADIWETFAQEVLDKWTAYEDAEGKRLNIRPHWAKEWYKYKVEGKSWPEKLKNETYRSEIQEFKGLLKEIGDKDDWTLQDMKSRFSNDLFDEMFLDDIQTGGATVPGNLTRKGAKEKKSLLRRLYSELRRVWCMRSVREKTM